MDPIILGPGEGRAYDLGAMRGVFKLDADGYCVSEWSVEPGGPGPGPHRHDGYEELFIVAAGTMSFLVGERWVDAAAGTFLRVPAGVTHDFTNRTSEPARIFNVSVPGGFEAEFAAWAGSYREGA